MTSQSQNRTRSYHRRKIRPHWRSKWKVALPRETPQAPDHIQDPRPEQAAESSLRAPNNGRIERTDPILRYQTPFKSLPLSLERFLSSVARLQNEQEPPTSIPQSHVNFAKRTGRAGQP